jgi:hypothetical protein
VSESDTFRSPAAIAIWWIWVLFAVGNLIDLAVQGRDHLSVVAAFILLFVTGIVFVTAQRPKVVADDAGLTVVNPFRGHRTGWAAVTAIDAADLLRIRCEWQAGQQQGKRVIYAWAVHASRRRQAAAQMRERRRAHQAARHARGTGFGDSRMSSASRGFGLFGGAAAHSAPPPAPIGLDAGKIVGTLNARADLARSASPDERASAPVSTWDWVAVAAIVVPGLALLIAALA